MEGLSAPLFFAPANKNLNTLYLKNPFLYFLNLHLPLTFAALTQPVRNSIIFN